MSEERFRALMQDLQVGIVLLGPNAETLFAERAVLKTFGVRDEQVPGKSSAEFEAAAIREDGREMPFTERPAPRPIVTKRPARGEVVGWRRNGSNEILWTLVLKPNFHSVSGLVRYAVKNKIHPGTMLFSRKFPVRKFYR